MNRYALFLLLLLTVCLPLSAAGIVLTEKGKTQCQIVIESGERPRAVAFAGKELATWLGRVSGADIPIVKQPGKEKVKIYIGTPESSPYIANAVKAFPGDMEKLKDNDGYLIHAENDTIIITGASPKSVLNGAYTLLEQVTDIVFVRPLGAERGAGTVYGANADLKAKPGHIVDVPFLKDHRYYTCNLEPALWQTRNRNLIPVAFTRMDMKSYERYASMGVKWTCFIWLGRIIPAAKYLESHPEFFTELNGKRTAGFDYNVCFMNPDSPKYAVEEVERICKGLPKKVEVSGFSHGDHGIVCGCKLCTVPIDCGNGVIVKPEDRNFRSTQYAIFVNRIARMLAEKYPDMELQGGGYLFTNSAPGVKPEPNTAVRFCPYPSRQMKYPIYHDRNKKWRELAEGWAKAGGIPHVYEYYLCDATPRFYHPVADIMQKDLQYYRDKGIRGMYLDTTRLDSETGEAGQAHDMSAIEYYTMSRIMWNPDLNVDEIRREFCRRAYREAAEPMYAFYSLVSKCYYANTAIGGSWRDDPAATLNSHLVRSGNAEKALQHLTEAELKARHPASRELIQRIRNLYISYLPAKIVRKEDPAVIVPRIDTPPDMGRIGGLSWTGSAILPIDRFAGNRKPKNKMEETSGTSLIRLMHDGKYLYIGWRFNATGKGGLRQPRDTVPKGSTAEIYFTDDPDDRDKTICLMFDNNENQYDIKGNHETWDSIWSVKTSLRQVNIVKFWSAVIKIPLSDLDRREDGSVYAMFFDSESGRAWFGGKPGDPKTYRRLIFQDEPLLPYPKGNLK